MTRRCTTAVNAGVVSLAFAWVIGVYLGQHGYRSAMVKLNRLTVPASATVTDR